jgi:hypothetical protein
VRVALAVAVLVSLASARPARADEADDVAARGEELAKQGEWASAIAAFKAADHAHPRATYSCLVGLTYLRRDLLAQAELFLARCKDRGTAADPVPAWFDEAATQLAHKLDGAHLAAVTFTATPAFATLSIGSFQPDETFAPRTVHLAAGTYIVTASAAGYRDATERLVVADDAPRTLALRLELLYPPPSRVPLVVAIAGVAVVAAGFVYDEAEVQPVRSDLSSTQSLLAWRALEAELTSDRHVAIALWSAGAVAVATAAVLRLTVFRPVRPLTIGAAATRGGGIATVEWSP